MFLLSHYFWNYSNIIAIQYAYGLMTKEMDVNNGIKSPHTHNLSPCFQAVKLDGYFGTLRLEQGWFPPSPWPSLYFCSMRIPYSKLYLSFWQYLMHHHSEALHSPTHSAASSGKKTNSTQQSATSGIKDASNALRG